eukprot:m.42663 g.42663  ORF g.42663 m.42663 type:complete len:1323 (-) comp7069_c0_seq2:2542-6510(-)
MMIESKVDDILLGTSFDTPQKLALPAHGDRYIRALVVSKDGKKIISGGGDSNIVIHDINSGDVDDTFLGHKDTVRCLELTADGENVVSGSTDGSVKMWSLLSGRCERSTLMHTQGGVQSISLSSNNHLLATGGRDFAIKLWRFDTMAELRTLTGHTGWVYALKITNDSKHLVSCSRDGSVKIWDIHEGFNCCQSIHPHSDSIRWVTLTPDNTRIVSCSKDKTIQVMSFASGTVIRTLRGHTAAVESVHVLSNNQHAFSASDDESVRVWDLYSGTCLKVFIGHRNWVYTVALSPCGKSIFSGGRDNFVRIWSLDTGSHHFEYSGHSDYVREVLVCEEGRTMLSCSDDGLIKVWNVATGECFNTLKDHTDSVRSICLTRDQRYFVSASWDKTIKIWNISDWQCVRTLVGHTDSIRSAFVSGNGKVIVSGSRDQTVRVWDFASGNCTSVLNGHTDYVRAVVCNHDGSLIVSGSDDCLSKVWSNDECVHTFTNHTHTVATLAISADGKRVVSGSRDKSISLYNVEDNVLIQTWAPHTNDINYVSFADNDTKVLSCSHDGFMYVFDAKTAVLLRSFGVHNAPVYAVEAFHDAIFIASGTTIRQGKLNFNFDFPTLAYNHAVNPSSFLVNATVDGYSAHFLLERLVKNASLGITRNLEDVLDRNLPISFNFAPLLVAAISSTSEECVRSVVELMLRAINNTANASSITGSESATDISLSSPKPTATENGSPTHDGGMGLFWSPEINSNINEALWLLAPTFPSLLQKLLAESPLIPASEGTLASIYPHHSFPLGRKLKAEFAPCAHTEFPVWLFWGRFNSQLLHNSIGHVDIDAFLPSDLVVGEDGYSVEKRETSKTSGSEERDEVLNTLYQRRATMASFQDENENDHDAVSSAKTIPANASWKRNVLLMGREGGTRATAKIIPFPNITAGPRSHSDLLRALLLTKRANMFEGIIPQMLVEHRWRQFGKRNHTLNFVVYMITLALFVALGFINRKTENDIAHDDLSNPLNIGALAVGAILAILTLFALYREGKQVFHEDMSAYLTSIWNWLDVIRIGLTVATLVTFGLRDHDTTRVLCSLGAYIYWFGTLFYLQAYASTGPLVRMILEIIYDMKYFLLVLSIGVLAFANVFYLLTPDTTMDGYDDVADVLLTSFVALILVDAGVVQFDAGAFTVLLKLIFVVTMVLVPIVLLNLLIALMSDSYERIQDRATIEFYRLRAQIVHEQELFFSKNERLRRDWYPRYLHVLVPSSFHEATVDAEWQGVMHEIKQEIHNRGRQMAMQMNSTKQALAQLQDEVAQLQRDTSRQLNTMTVLLNQVLENQHEEKKHQ